MTRKQTLIVKLKRSTTGRPWGIRIAGGADLGTPIVVTRVSSSLILSHSLSFFSFIHSFLLSSYLIIVLIVLASSTRVCPMHAVTH